MTAKHTPGPCRLRIGGILRADTVEVINSVLSSRRISLDDWGQRWSGARPIRSVIDEHNRLAYLRREGEFLQLVILGGAYDAEDVARLEREVDEVRTVMMEIGAAIAKAKERGA